MALRIGAVGRVAARITTPAAAVSAPNVQIRGMATEKQLSLQIASTKNIQKITSSMKMVSAAKLKGDEKRLSLATPFNSWTTALNGEAVMLEDCNFEEFPQKTLFVPFTSEKGLCGGVNSYVSRGIRDSVKALKGLGKDCDVVVIGDKGRSAITRMASESVSKCLVDLSSPNSFELAASLASQIIDHGAMTDYDQVVLVYNSFQNAATYFQKYKVIKPMVGEGESESMVAYEFEPDTKSEVMTDMYEYLLASQIFHCLMDAAASEQSSRMSAMENATKNSGEMIEKLTLQYNRARQARITTELIEIISGASALDD